jgi:hypothetical protein
MSGIPSGTGDSDGRARWAALDSQYERLVDAADRLLIEPDRPADSDLASRTDRADQRVRTAS